jgi:enamine deaminase RidA (YjgF/YER057c/UK114 family)
MRTPVEVPWFARDRYTFAPAVRSGDLLFVSGMTATDENGVLVAPGDIVGQARCIFEKLSQVLEAAGATFDDVVMTRDYFVTTEGYRGTAAIRREFFGEEFSAATGVQVAGLLREGALIEIEAVAVVKEG